MAGIDRWDEGFLDRFQDALYPSLSRRRSSASDRPRCKPKQLPQLVRLVRWARRVFQSLPDGWTESEAQSDDLDVIPTPAIIVPCGVAFQFAPEMKSIKK